ncbi:MAG TPA: DUF4391 domain-containing protein [Campylobacterales bacterium]|nr:DUF4391 domain-containing protein [Campylobacterales bacterium]
MKKTLLDKLHIPLTCRINRKLFKKQFIENFTLNANEKKIISEDVENITLEYLLNKDKINITPFNDEEYDYSEIAFIRVELLSTKRLKKLSNIIQYIPYPLIVFFTNKNKVCINISPKRINKNDSSKLVVEESYFTDWIDLRASSKIEQEFLESLEIKNHPFTNFFEFYNSYLNKLIAFNASRYSGSLEQSEDTKELLREIQEVESNINDIISKIKKETDIRDKVNLNIELKKITEKLENLKTKLQG